MAMSANCNLILAGLQRLSNPRNVAGMARRIKKQDWRSARWIAGSALRELERWQPK